MPFSYYQTSVAISDSASSSAFSSSLYETFAGGAYNDAGATSCKTNYYGTAYGFATDTDGNYVSQETTESITLIYPKSIYLTESQSAEYNSPFQNAVYSIIYCSSYLNESVSTSVFPYKTFKWTFSSSFSDYDLIGTVLYTNSSSHSETGNGVQGSGNDGGEFLAETFTFTSTYEIQPTTTFQGSTTFYFGTNPESTTYSVLTTNATSGQSVSGSFTSTRDYDFIFYKAVQNISRSFDLKYFRPVEPNSEWVSQNNLLRLFFSTGDSYLISDYDALLNETMSAQFSKSGAEISVGSTAGTQPATSVTLTTNGISQYPTSSQLFYFADLTFNYGQKTFGFVYSTESYQYNYSNYSTTSSTISYFIPAYGGPAGFGSNYATSAYSQSYARIVSTTSSYFDISANLVTHITYTKTRTISTTSSGLLLTYVYLATGGNTTEYAYPSYLVAGINTVMRTPYNDFRTFSSQKTLHGNFIKNIDAETAYWSLDVATFGGIFDFSCYARRGNTNFPENNPKFFRFTDCYVVAPFDPISSTLEGVSINQSVSSDTGGTSISQTVGYDTTSTTRTFAVNYQESTGTMPWTWDSVVDFDNDATLGYLGAGQQESRAIGPTPIVSISANDILNTYGQMGQANYMADGGYFKENSSSVKFITTTYTQPISVESFIGNDNWVSMFTILSQFGGIANHAVSMSKGLQQFQTYY